MLARLFNASPEILRRIALFTVFNAEHPGPPRDFLNLSLVCHASHRILTHDAAPLYVDIFAQTFDILGPLFKLGASTVQANAKVELQRRFSALRIFRGENFDDPNLTEAFWIAYMMFEDSDTGQKNTKQLMGARLHSFLDRFLRKRLYRGSETNNGWPIPSEQNSLAVALFWLSSSQLSLYKESAEEREEMALLLKPFVFAAFRYPIFSTSEFCFDVATFTHQATSSSVHGPYPPSPLLPRDVAYFGTVSRTVRVPSVSLFAALSFFTRQETRIPELPPHLQPDNRSGDPAICQGPTLDDVKHFIVHCNTHFADFPGLDVGVAQSHTDTSPTPAHSLVDPSPYKLGTLTGSWRGSYIMPYLEDYASWLHTLTAPPEFPTTGRSPLYMTLQEHYTRNPASVLPGVDAATGTTNAWLPADSRWIQRENGIEVFDEKGTFRTRYETVKPGASPVDAHGDVLDVIITGKPDPQHAAAWGDYRIFGRIRLADGLVMLAREPLDGTGPILLRGYALPVTSSQNFVGRFKGVSSGTEPAGWEAAFSLCQVREDVRL
ncbi:hypothetical protein LshimejAT787_1701580 [Lyophyllum shimeji]|uniref:Uncharacterized protein n=1 Tax=Lyophyllum shimeji TaxID=47721 RepID=A0A9P3UVW0_LYOSH|nr:hypothetical protein LshimejAT787_1701580 [Lyophyllum shimeji]